MGSRYPWYIGLFSEAEWRNRFHPNPQLRVGYDASVVSLWRTSQVWCFSHAEVGLYCIRGLQMVFVRQEKNPGNLDDNRSDGYLF